MADWHLAELRTAIERIGWRFVAEHPSEHLSISGSWEFERDSSESNLFIDFGGIDDLRTLPMDESYCCHVRGSARGLYFTRKAVDGSDRRKTWKQELENFIDTLK